jgi:hypothetical protein
MGRPISVCTKIACTDSPEAIEESLARGEKSTFFKQLMRYIEELVKEVERAG